MVVVLSSREFTVTHHVACKAARASRSYILSVDVKLLLCFCRGNSDAVNVHPFEYICGEYNHLLAIMLVPCHIVAALAFIVVGGVLASLNHTRFDAIIPWGIYDVKVHDLHHRVPQSNYGQYIMLWDRIMGSYRAYT
eukprot:1523119-Pyramimonas_sp.AAC.2